MPYKTVFTKVEAYQIQDWQNGAPIPYPKGTVVFELPSQDTIQMPENLPTVETERDEDIDAKALRALTAARRLSRDYSALQAAIASRVDAEHELKAAQEVEARASKRLVAAAASFVKFK